MLGLADMSKRRKNFHYLNIRQFDVTFLQETHSTKNCEKRWRSEFGGRIIYAHGTNNARGVAILIKKKLPIKIKFQHCDANGRWIILETKIENVQVNLVNIYAPTSNSPDFFVQIFDELSKIGNSNIVGGDWNMVLDLKQDKKRGHNQTHFKSQKVVKTFMALEFLTDIWQTQHPTGRLFTWGITNRGRVLERLDFFLVSDQILAQCCKSDIMPAYLSDHSIPYIMYKIGNQKRGPGFWKLNTSLLNDEDYLNEVGFIIDQILAQELESYIYKWELINWKFMDLQ